MTRFRILDPDQLPEILELIRQSKESAKSKKMISAHNAIERSLTSLSEQVGMADAFTRLFQTLFCSGNPAEKRAQMKELTSVTILEAERAYFLALVYLIASHAVKNQAAVFSTRNEVRPPAKVNAEFQDTVLWKELTPSFKFSHELVWHQRDNEIYNWSDVADAFYKYCDDNGHRYKWTKHVLRSFCRLCFYSGVNEVKEINGSLINWFKNNDLSTSDRSIGFIPDFLVLNGAPSALDDPDENYTPDIAWLEDNLHPSPGENDPGQKEVIINGQTFIEERQTSLAWAGLKGTKVLKKPVRREKNFGGWVFDGPASKYKFDNLIEEQPNSTWLLAEMDFIGSLREASTKKNKNNHISIFNAYLFGYLPYAINECKIDRVRWPSEPKLFHSAVFVGRSRLIMNQWGVSADSRMPLTIVEFLEIYYDAEDEQTNAPRDCLADIGLFFDYVSAKLSENPGCRLDSNPITLSDRRAFRGYGYRTSRKKVPDFEYWILFREFVYDLAEAMIENIHAPKPKARCGTVKVDKDIEFADYKTRVGTIDVSSFSSPILTAGHDGLMPLYSENPRNVIILLMMAFSGLRFSNVLWLDADTYDMESSLMEGYWDVHVNTDKAKVGPFESMLPDRVMKLVRRYAKARLKFPSKFYDPVYYQGNKDSKWGIIHNPLFDSPTTRWDDGINLTGIIATFEDQMPSNYDLGSELFFAPEFMPYSTFNKRIKNGLDISDALRYIENDELDPIAFTPIRQRSLVSAHSLRTTLDSYMSLLLPAKLVGQLFTGQTEETVRYYVKVTPEMERKLLDYKERGILDFVPESLVRVKEVEKEEDETVLALKERGLSAINAITVSRAKDSRDDLDRLIGLADPKDIAINRTHICIHGNECPPEILEQIKSKNCGICPHAISCVSDAPAIAATIRDQGDRVQEINSILHSGDITRSERDDLVKERVKCVNIMAGWVMRQKLIDEQIDRGNGFFTSREGQEKVLQKFVGMKIADHNEQMMARILEVEKVPALQSRKLTLQADRLARRLLDSIKDGSFNLPQLNEIDLASSLIDKTAKLHGFSARAIVNHSSGVQQVEHIDG